MNLSFGDTNLIVTYLQAFLKEQYSSSVLVTGVFDEITHANLISYLNLSNVYPINEVQNACIAEFPDIPTYFTVSRGLEDFTLVSKATTQETIDYMKLIHDKLVSFLDGYGWYISEWTNFYSSTSDKYIIVISADARDNKFPNKDLLCLINQFSNTYSYGLAIRDGIGIDDIIHKSSGFKLAVIACKPNQTFTISHGFTVPTDLVIASSQYPANKIPVGNLPVTNTVETILQAGEAVLYTTSNNAQNLLIQIPSSADILNGGSTVRIPVMLGDVNLDGVVDATDRQILADHIAMGTLFKGEQFVAADINQDGIVDNADLAMLDDYLNGVIPTLGVSYYDEILDLDTSNLTKLLVIDGDFVQNQDISIPFNSFSSDPWIVHDKFINYLINMSITPYSDTDSIAYVQNMVLQLWTQYKCNVGTYDDLLREYIQDYQIGNGVSFSLGLMDVETEALMVREVLASGGTINEYF